MPENGQYDWSMLHMLMVQTVFVVFMFVVVVDSMYLPVFNMMYHNGTICTEKVIVPLN